MWWTEFLNIFWWNLSLQNFKVFIPYVNYRIRSTTGRPKHVGVGTKGHAYRNMHLLVSCLLFVYISAAHYNLKLSLRVDTYFYSVTLDYILLLPFFFTCWLEKVQLVLFNPQLLYAFRQSCIKIHLTYMAYQKSDSFRMCSREAEACVAYDAQTARVSYCPSVCAVEHNSLYNEINVYDTTHCCLELGLLACDKLGGIHQSVVIRAAEYVSIHFLHRLIIP